MRSIWNGAISFGLVTIPIKIYAATEEKTLALRQVHRADGAPIQYRRFCTVDEQEVPYEDVAKGYELPGGEMVVLTDDDLADLPLSSSRTIELVRFVPAEQIDPIYFSRSYYLEPDKAGLRPYAVLREALLQSGKLAVVRVTLRRRESLGVLRVSGGVFVLETMLWPDEVRPPEFGFLDDGEPDVRPQELAMASLLVDELSGDFEPAEYHDSYRDALQALVEAKAAGQQVAAPPAPTVTGGADLLSALRASVAAAQQRRADDAAETGVPKPRIKAVDEPDRPDEPDQPDRPRSGRKTPSRKPVPAKVKSSGRRSRG